MTIYPLQGKENQIEITTLGETNMNLHETARIAKGAIVYGDVTLGEKSSIWYNAVVRGDQSTIEIGKYSNIHKKKIHKASYYIGNALL